MINFTTLQLFENKISDLKTTYNKAMIAQEFDGATRLLQSIAKYEDLKEIEQRFEQEELTLTAPTSK